MIYVITVTENPVNHKNHTGITVRTTARSPELLFSDDLCDCRDLIMPIIKILWKSQFRQPPVLLNCDSQMIYVIAVIENPVNHKNHTGITVVGWTKRSVSTPLNLADTLRLVRPTGYRLLQLSALTFMSGL